MSRWYRAYEGTVTDAKLGEAALVAEVSRSVAIAAWHCLLESAAGRNNCGSFDATPRRIAVILCEPPAKIETLFVAFGELGLIGDSAVKAWKRRQFESDTSTERVRKHRRNKPKATRNADETFQQPTVTAPDTDSETEVSEPKGSSPRAWSLPAGVPLQVWQDFKKNRERKRLPNTETAWKTFNDDLKRISAQTGIPPPELIRQCAAKGWASINDPRDENGRRTNSLGRHQPDDGLSSTARAAVAVFGAPARQQ